MLPPASAKKPLRFIALTSLSAESSQKSGRVTLVGAGPGDPGLITVAGLERLRRAEVVIYDALASPALLDLAPPEAQRIDAGKRARQHKLTQDQINDLLVQHARKGRFVVRLKGGDPYLFGRGAEEALHLAQNGVAFEVIPGITAGMAAPMAAGIPVTHRQIASTVTFVTGHEDPTKEASVIDYEPLARLIAAGGTVCFYMGIARLQAIVAALIASGLDADTPAAVIQWGTTARQRSVRAALAELPKAVQREQVGAPAMIVVGKVVAMAEAEPGLDYFTARPLFGQTIIVTRTRQQASELRHRLEELGAEVIEAPTIDIEFLPAPSGLDTSTLGNYHWLILTSANAVEWLARWLDAEGLDARVLGGVRVAVVGQATVEALHRRLGVRADFVPRRGDGESLARQMIETFAVAGSRCLLLRGDLAGDAVPRLLGEAGAAAVEHTVYRTRPVDLLPEAALTALRERRVHWVTFTSSSTVRNMMGLLAGERDLLHAPRLASIGPMTSQAVREEGFSIAVEAEQPSIAAIVEAIMG